MSEGKRHDPELNVEAATELDAQARGAGYDIIRKWLLELAENLASNDSDRGEDLRDLVERKHVLLAAEKLFASDPTGVLLGPGHGIFLTYSTKDEDFARELEADLREEGVRAFLAPLAIKPGSSWPDEIWQAIAPHRCGLPSPHPCYRCDPWLKKSCRHAVVGYALHPCLSVSIRG